ncbi:predicted protein [Postia placenta Mad-698-R]|nr:predicted protein [Postia placenta Mad-698-R]
MFDPWNSSIMMMSSDLINGDKGSPSIWPFPNGTCPIYRLAPETLTEILMFCFQYVDTESLLFSSDEEEEWNAMYDANVFIASLMLVCRHWRDVILHTSAFWSCVMIGERARLTRLPPHLERSHITPIRVYLRGCHPNFLPIINFHLWRTKELYLWFEERHPFERVALEALSMPAQRLQVLFVKMVETQGTLLPHMFSGFAPRLRQIYLSPLCLRPVDYFANLTHLRLANQADNWEWKLSTLLDTLEASPNLEVLDLFAVLDDDTPLDGPKRVVALPKLSVFELTYYEEDVVSLILTHISIPVSTRLIIGDIVEGSSVSEVFPIDVTHLENLSQITRIYVNHQHDFVTFAGFGEDGHSSLLYDSSYHDNMFETSTWRTLGDFLNVKKLTELWIDISCPRRECDCDGLSKLDSAELWATILEPMANLRLISVGHNSARAIIKALTPGVSTNSAPSIRAPSLKEFLVYDPHSISAHLLDRLHLHVALAGPPIDELLVLSGLQGMFATQIHVQDGEQEGTKAITNPLLCQQWRQGSADPNKKASLEESEADADLKNASMKRCRKSEDGVNVVVKCFCRMRAGSCRNKCLDEDTLRRVDTSLKGYALLDCVR